MPIHCQCVLRADVPAVNRFDHELVQESTQDQKIVRKIRKRADDQYKVSAIFTMGLERTCANVEQGYFNSR